MTLVGEDRRLLLGIAAVMAAFTLLVQAVACRSGGAPSLPLLGLSLAAAAGVTLCCLLYLRRRDKRLDDAAQAVRAYLDGDTARRIDCDGEGALCRLFHAVNTLAAVLNAHAEQELRAKTFLKDTISDVSHQLKTPLAALNVYNGLVQEEAKELPAVGELAALSERELDRIESLVGKLLTIARIDAGAITLKKIDVNVSEMMQSARLHFAHRAEREGKEILLAGSETATLRCDRDWMEEAVGNLIKNALDHTGPGGHVFIDWKQSGGLFRILVRDDGEGIHPQDIHHIFKRFYRSRFSKDGQGVGLGLPLVKAIVEAHGGSVAVGSEPGRGAIFTLDFLIPTKL